MELMHRIGKTNENNFRTPSVKRKLNKSILESFDEHLAALGHAGKLLLMVAVTGK